MRETTTRAGSRDEGRVIGAKDLEFASIVASREHP